MRYFAWLIIIFAYVTVVLSAMQVVLTIDGFKDNPRIISVSYGFSVFSMVLVAVVSGVAIPLFAALIMTVLAHIARVKEKAKDRAIMKDY